MKVAKMKDTVELQRWKICIKWCTGCIVGDHFALDNAISMEAAKHRE